MEPLPPAEAADMLSSLPAHLLDDILTRLDLRDVVRTSVLSCAWRRRWESLPGLALCFPKGTRRSVITRVLLCYTGPRISRFVPHVADDERANDDVNDDVDDWLIALSRRSVESIVINLWHLENFTLPSSIFSCDRLVSLNLQHCNIPPLPRSRFAGFPVLQELYLSFVNFADKGESELQAIIRGSPLLRVLEIVDVVTLVDCVIEAPNLQTLVLNSSEDNDGWRFGRLPRLQYAKIDVAKYLPHGHGGHRLLQIFAGVSQVRGLYFYSPDDENKVKIDRIPFTFHNLKSLEIETQFVHMEHILILFSLLRSSPNLEELKIEIRDMKPEWVSEEWTDAQWTDGMCANLRVVQIDNYFADSGVRCLPLSFMKLILSKASLLRTLSVGVCPVSQDDPLNELLKCRRASAQTQVLFKEDLDSDTDGELSERA